MAPSSPHGKTTLIHKKNHQNILKMKKVRASFRNFLKNFWDRKIFENFRSRNFSFSNKFQWKFSISKIFKNFQKVALTFFIFKMFWWFFFMDRCNFSVRSEWRGSQVLKMKLEAYYSKNGCRCMNGDLKLQIWSTNSLGAPKWGTMQQFNGEF